MPQAEVITDIVAIRGKLESSRREVQKALPVTMNDLATTDRFIRIALTSIRRTPKLMKCTPISIVASVVQAAALGLELDGVLGHAYLVPFFNSKRGVTEATFMPGYKGRLLLARNSGDVDMIYADVVKLGDMFDLERGDSPHLKHKPSVDADDARQILGFYAVAFMKSGRVHFEYLGKAKVDAIRARSMSKDSPAWVEHYEEMGKGKAVNRLCKWLPMSVDNRNLERLVAHEERIDAGLEPEDDGVIDVTADEVPPKGKLDQLVEAMEPSAPRVVVEPVEPPSEEPEPIPVEGESVDQRVMAVAQLRAEMVAYHSGDEEAAVMMLKACSKTRRGRGYVAADSWQRLAEGPPMWLAITRSAFEQMKAEHDIEAS